MTAQEEASERMELIWVLGSLILSFHFAFRFVDSALGSAEPGITRFLCGSVLGFSLGGSFAIAGLPFVHFLAWLKNKVFWKGAYERTEPTDSSNS